MQVEIINANFNTIVTKDIATYAEINNIIEDVRVEAVETANEWKEDAPLDKYDIESIKNMYPVMFNVYEMRGDVLPCGDSCVYFGGYELIEEEVCIEGAIEELESLIS